MQTRDVGRQRRVADEERGVVLQQHLAQHRSVLVVADVVKTPATQEDLQKGGRSAGVRVERHAADLLEGDARHQDHRADPALAGDADLGQELDPRQPQVFDRRDESDVHLVRAQQIRDPGRRDLRHLEDSFVWTSQEPPGERLGVDERNRCDAHVVHGVANTSTEAAGRRQGASFYQMAGGSQRAPGRKRGDRIC